MMRDTSYTCIGVPGQTCHVRCFQGEFAWNFHLEENLKKKKIYRNYFRFNTVVMGEIWGDDDVPF